MRLPTKKAQTERVPYLLLQYIKSTDTQEPGQEPESVCTVRIVAATYSEDESEGATCVLNLLTRNPGCPVERRRDWRAVHAETAP